MSQDKNDRKTSAELHQQLDYLKLQFMREHCEELAQQAAQNQWSHVDFLVRLVAGEAARRNKLGVADLAAVVFTPGHDGTVLHEDEDVLVILLSNRTPGKPRCGMLAVQAAGIAVGG